MSFIDSKANVTGMQPNPDHPGGKKVTDPNAPVIPENPGPIASDSLAAQSATFQTNKNSNPLGVSGANSTFANKNISGAQTLEPTDVGSSRPEITDKMGTNKGHFPKSDRESHAVINKPHSANYQHNRPGQSELDADNGSSAPSYVNPVLQDTNYAGGENVMKVKGKNLKEIGKRARFDEEGKTRKGLESEDREAVRSFQTANALRDTGGIGGNGVFKGESGTRFDSLGDTGA